MRPVLLVFPIELGLERLLEQIILSTMNSLKGLHPRRSFLKLGLLGGLSLPISQRVSYGAESLPAQEVCAFVKFLQNLSFEDLARTIRKMGFDGIEGTVRPGGLITPEKVDEDLPRLMEALRRESLEMTIMASGINRIDDPVAEHTLRLATKWGVKRYRMNYFRYDMDKPMAPQRASFKAMAKDLAAFNHELGIQALYQNHAGARYLGATMWDLVDLLEGIPQEDISIGFDVRHAKVEAGLSWPVYWEIARPHLGALYVKDFVWDQGKVINVPLGQGWVGEAFFHEGRLKHFQGPITLHVEYLQQAGSEANAQALNKDLATLRQWVKSI